MHGQKNIKLKSLFTSRQNQKEIASLYRTVIILNSIRSHPSNEGSEACVILKTTRVKN